MTIAIDIDGTLTLDPVCWIKAIALFRERGHSVFYVTGAKQPPEKLASLGIIPADTVVICPGFKADYVHSLGYRVDIWIDNEPGTIEPARKPNPTPDSAL